MAHAKGTYNALTRRWMKRNGWDFDGAEKFSKYGMFARDLFNFIDFVALSSKDGIIGVQSTSSANHSARKKKILASHRAINWLKAGGLIVVISWRKVESRWIHKAEYITVSDFE